MKYSYIPTGKKAFKARCYWDVGSNGWYLANFTGDVYQREGRFWLKTPRSYTAVFEKDIT